MPKPGMMDFVARAKWDSWSGLGDMPIETVSHQSCPELYFFYPDAATSTYSSQQAQAGYADFVEGILGPADAAQPTVHPAVLIRSILCQWGWCP